MKKPAKNTACSLPGCEKEKHPTLTSSGYCSMHHFRKVRNGSPHITSVSRKYELCCIVQDCKNPVRSRSLCNLHLARYYRQGDPNISTKRFWTKKEDAHLLALLNGDLWGRTKNGEVRALAEHLERTAKAAASRLCDLRKREKAKLRAGVKNLE